MAVTSAKAARRICLFDEDWINIGIFCLITSLATSKLYVTLHRNTDVSKELFSVISFRVLYFITELRR